MIFTLSERGSKMEEKTPQNVQVRGKFRFHRYMHYWNLSFLNATALNRFDELCSCCTECTGLSLCRIYFARVWDSCCFLQAPLFNLLLLPVYMPAALIHVFVVIFEPLCTLLVWTSGWPITKTFLKSQSKGWVPLSRKAMLLKVLVSSAPWTGKQSPVKGSNL